MAESDNILTKLQDLLVGKAVGLTHRGHKLAQIFPVRHTNGINARQLLTWLQGQECAAAPARQPAGAMAMLGFARRFRPERRTTAEWMDELRAGERE
jgi:hypothetical protein